MNRKIFCYSYAALTHRFLFDKSRDARWAIHIADQTDRAARSFSMAEGEQESLVSGLSALTKFASEL